MEDLKITDVGLAGVMMLMMFQYIVRPVVTSLLKKTETPKSELDKKVDKTTCKILHAQLDDSNERLEAGQGEIIASLNGLNREMGEVKAILKEGQG
jgi:hypothetical protein